MKKVILCATALVFGTMAYAQVSGAPTASTSVTNLSPDATANVGQSVQNGDDNKVRVRQAGTSQSVYTEQDNGTGIGGNLARVMQTGAVTSNSGELNRAEVLQSGSTNQSSTYQEGDLNNAITMQGQIDGSSTDNKALIQQGTGDQAESNYAAIEQNGDDNQANTLQTYDNNDAWTRQAGDANKSMIVQDAGPENSSGHEAMNWQSGDNNESSINQSGAARNIAVAAQSGDDNQSKQIQTTIAPANTGMGNRGVVAQGFPTVLTDGDIPLSNTAFNEIFNTVDNAVVATLSSSVSARALQVQNGKLQEAEIVQMGGTADASNYAEQVQFSGWNNDATALQIHSGSSDNYSKQYQAGDNNRAGLVQNGSGHKSLQDQRGHRNSALSSQIGEGNLLNVHQRGNDNFATSAQRGEANAALIVQRDGQSFVAQQNLDGLGGGGNQIDALQVGPNGNFGSNAIDCGFETPVDLGMDYSVPGFDLEPICPGC